MNREAIVQLLQANFATLFAVYAFGSRVRGEAGSASDCDLAILVEGYVDPLVLWTVSGQLADRVGCPVDLLDFRAASTVMQYQILTTGVCYWRKDPRVACYEAGILSDKTELDRARAGLLADIAKRGKIYD